MEVTMFLSLLFAFSVISSLIVEAIKKIIGDKKVSYNLIAVITALVVGCGGTAIYYQLSSIPYTTNNVIYLVLMGLASGLSSMVGYDKVKETIEQLFK